MLQTPTDYSNLRAPYSTDLATCDFFIFQKFKAALKGQSFESTKEIQKSVGLKRHSTKCVPGMLQTMVAPVEVVCEDTRNVLCRLPHRS
jgi:hypothetical protein